MNRSVGRLAKLTVALFLFDRIATTAWGLLQRWLNLPRSGMDREVEAAAGVAMILVGWGLLHWSKDRLEGLLRGAVASRSISLRPGRLGPIEGAAAGRLGFSLALALAFVVLASGVVWLDQAWRLPDEPWVLAASFAVLCGVFWWSYSTAEHRFHVRRAAEAGSYEAMILFLSDNKNLKGSHPLAVNVRTEWPDEAQLQREFNALGRDNCLMPMLSIRHQLRVGGLHFVLVIPSIETHASVDSFKKLVDATFPNHGLTIEEIGNAGVDYLDPPGIWRMLDLAHERARQLGARSVMLDLTAGKAQCSAAGAVASLTPGRVFKYIDTTSYRQLAFEITHEADPEVPGQ